jgi:hypothetical protein
MPSPNRRRVRNVAVALLVLGLAAWIVPSYFSAERYRRRLEAGLEQALHRPVKFGDLSFRLLPRPGFSIQDVEVDEDADFGSEPFARVDQIDCDLRWHSLWRSRMDFARLHLDHPSFNVVLNSRGDWNVEKLLLQSGVTAPASAAAGPNHSVTAQQLDLDVNDARINFQVGPNKKPFALTDVRASLQVNPAERRVHFQITASPVRSNLTLPTPGPVEVSGTWTPGAELSGPIDAHVRTRGALLYDWIPVITGANPQIYGVMDSDIHLAGSLPDLIVEGETDLTQLQRWGEPPPSDPMPWTLRYRGRLLRGQERIQVESLDATFADSHLHVSGSVDKLQSDPQLDCVVSLERSRLEDVLSVVRRVWPSAGAWSAKGRIDAMLAVQGPWKDRRYGGYVGVRQASLETNSGSFPVSDVAVHVNNEGAILAPVQITLAPRVTLTAQGSIDRKKTGPQYELQLGAKGVPLRNAVSFGSGMGIRALHAIGATGSLTASINLAGSAWPLGRPVLSARGEIRAARLLIPGLTEPLNLPRASVQVTGDEITADPVVAVLGTSVFNARLAHRGGRGIPWKIDVHANSLNLEQAALWFDALGLRRPLPLLERLPGLTSFAARHEAASYIFESLNADVRFATPELTYRGLTFKDFQGAFAVGGRVIRMTAAAFRAGGGHGDAKGAVDFTASPPLLCAQAAIAGVAVQSLTDRLPGPVRDLRGSLSLNGNFRTHGLGHDELADNLTGQMQVRARDISFGNFDPLGTLAQDSHWGKLEPVRGPITALPTTLNLDIRDRRFILNPAALDLGGASLQIQGTYAWTGAVDLKVRTDVRRLRRRWLPREDAVQAFGPLPEVRLSGPVDHLVVNPQEVVVTAGRTRGGGIR